MSDGKLGAVVADEDEKKASGSAKIREATGILRELMLRDQYAEERILGTMVREGLNEITLDLTELEGMQVLFEQWIGAL